MAQVREILGPNTPYSSYYIDPYIIRLLVVVGGETIVFEEPVEGFPSEKLLAQLMLIAPVEK